MRHATRNSQLETRRPQVRPAHERRGWALLTLILLLLLLPMILLSDTYGPVAPLSPLPMPETIFDIHLYGGYLYAAGYDNLYIYDLINRSLALKGSFAYGHSEKAPRLYHYRNQLIISYFNTMDDNGLLFYDISNPLNPVLLYAFNPKELWDGYGYLSSGFPSECLFGCAVAGDYFVCLMNWIIGDREDPCDNFGGGTGVPFALHLPDYYPIDIMLAFYSSYCEEYEYICDPAQFVLHHGEWEFPQGYGGSCSFPSGLLDTAYQAGERWTSYCPSCNPYVGECGPGGQEYLYRDRRFGVWGCVIKQDPCKNGATTISEESEDLSKARLVLFPPALCDDCLGEDEYVISHWDIQAIVAHEDWVFATFYKCRALLNYDSRDPGWSYDNEPVMGMNHVEDPLTQALVLNDILYAVGGSTLYRFDPPRHDDQRPLGTLNVTADGSSLHCHGVAWDDDGIQSVYVRIGDDLIGGDEFPASYTLPVEEEPDRSHDRPFDPPRSWNIDLDTSTLTPGAYTIRAVALDWEGSLSVIGEQEIVIGAEGKAKKRNPGGGGR